MKKYKKDNNSSFHFNIHYENYIYIFFQQVKEDNLEISGMERKITDLEEQIFKCKERLSQLDMDIDTHQGIFFY